VDKQDQPVTTGFAPDLPMEIAGGLQPPTMPLVPADYWNKILVRQPSKIDGDAAHISMRVPLEWMEAISVLRDWQKYLFPSRVIWPTVSDFARSALADFIENISMLKLSTELGQLPENSSTGLITVQMFTEQTDGELLARTRTMQRVQKQAWQLAQGIRNLMNLKEPVEAADLVSNYVERTTRMREQTGRDFWERYCLTALFRIPSAIEDVTSLIQGEYIIDENIIANLEHVTHLIETGELGLYIGEDDGVQAPPLNFATGDNNDNTSNTDDADSDSSSNTGRSV
jgi:hypothetical protein